METYLKRKEVANLNDGERNLLTYEVRKGVGLV